MAPPEGSIFDPVKKWDEEKKRRAKALSDAKSEATFKKKTDKKSKQGKKKAADAIREANAAEKDNKDHRKDLEKLSNLRTLKALREAGCETGAGRINRMLKMLHLSVTDLKLGNVNGSEAEVLDILWALEEMPIFKTADQLLGAEKKAKKVAEKKEKKDKKKDKKDRDSSEKKEKIEKVELTPEAVTLKTLFKDGDARGNYKDSLRFARKLMSGKKDLISFQLTKMPDRLPPLSVYNRRFQLEDWQCEILDAIDERRSAVVCAPTSSGKTILSTYTCKAVNETVLFVLPSEVLVWQVASTYYEFFRGNVTICTDQISFQEISGDAQVYVGTPRALEAALTKARGVAGQEMTKGEREFMILDGGLKFGYVVLDEVHTLNGPEGDALERIIKATDCPCLALSATIGNAVQLQEWFTSVREMQEMKLIEGEKSKEYLLKEHFARFINLQRYVVTYEDVKDGKKVKLGKLHPVAAMTGARLADSPELIAGLSMTPTDMMDLWRRMRSIFPSTALEEMDDPDHYFTSQVDESKRITLTQTKDYEMHLKRRLAVLSKSHPDLFERLRKAQEPPELVAKSDVSDELYDVMLELKASDLLPAVAFKLDTYGAFGMFKKLLERLEGEQVAEYPTYRKDLIKMAREKAALRKQAAGIKGSAQTAQDAEQEAQAGFEDDVLVSEDTTKPHDKYILTSSAKRLNFTEVEDIIADMKKSGESVDINHALIRGLRRGIAIYTNEVGFSCYRRQVQMLAQKGRLAVVFSDSALAYGVNMPFRSCIFCGDMGTALTPLIANQMQGRAGRRGMDVQGNVIYLGMSWDYIENLMLGQISKVVGNKPRYPVMALERAIAASNDPDDYEHFVHDELDGGAFGMSLRKRNRQCPCHPTITEDMMEWKASTTLEEFTEDRTNNSYYSLSKDVCQALGYVDSNMKLLIDHNVATMIYELHDRNLPSAIFLASTVDMLYERFCNNKTRVFKESDATQNEFISCILHVADRVPCPEGEVSLQEYLNCVVTDTSKGKSCDENSLACWLETEKILRTQYDRISGLDIDQTYKDEMLLSLPPATKNGDVGPFLDRGVYEMLSTKQKGFRPEQTIERRNDLKNRVVSLGHFCLVAHNNIQQPHGKNKNLEVYFRKLFNNIKYCLADMMNQLTDQVDLTEV
uniref:Helicase ATP-binding domain-containing protein n=1 Tax=Corethron hystrix TaxID=216773 RepID=A0A7S1BV22_9STRA